MQEKHLYIIDGHALAYRSYYATLQKPLTNSKGQPTGAVFGFAVALRKLLKEYRCPYVVIVFDSPTPTFRHSLYAQYKANREEMPEDMKTQLPYIFKLVELFNIYMLRQEGLEADDIIAHLTRKATASGFVVSLVSKDKDLMQLVCGNVRMLAPESGGSFDVYGPAEVQEKMGVPPEQIRDLLALMGDSSDNIPGVPGIGPKTAAKILKKVGTLDALLEHPSLVDNPKIQAAILEHRADLQISRQLATLRPEIDLAVGIEALRAHPPNREKCIEFFKELEFRSFLNDPLFSSSATLDFRSIVPSAISDVAPMVERIMAAGFLSIDTETTSTNPREAELVGISVAITPCEAMYIPVGHTSEPLRNLPKEKVLELLRPIVESDKILKIGQNLKYDYQIFRNYGMKMRGISFDCMIAAYLLDPGKRQYSLDVLARDLLGIVTIPIDSLIGKKSASQKPFSQVAVEQAARYSGEDVVIPLRLRAVLEPQLQERGLEQLFRDVEIPLVTVLAEMEWYGICLDSTLLSTLAVEFRAKLEAISAEIFQLADNTFNLNSPRQVAAVLFDQLKLPKSRKTKTGLSTDSDTLEKLAPQHPIVAKILEYREVQKLLSTYIEALPTQVSPISGRLHSSFNQTVTATGRLSSNNPNLQNIPVRTEEGRRIRCAFTAPKNYRIVSADYSQIELRILAHLSKDPLLLKAFKEDRDIHAHTASVIYGIAPNEITAEMRRVAKTINFGLIYGMGPVNLSRQLNISFTEAQAFIDTYFTQFPTIRHFIDATIEDARAKGYVETLLGRRRYLPDINSENRQAREAAQRTAINTPIQGTAADIIKIAMINIHCQMSDQFPEARLLLQVHDELVFEMPTVQVNDFIPWVTRLMEAAYPLDIPLKVDVGSGANWNEAH